MNIKPFIRLVKNYPSNGILFRDITPLIYSPEIFSYILENLCKNIDNSKINVICAIDSRGFIFGAPVAHKMGIPLVLLRKKGKLPPSKLSFEYQLEYGQSTLELSCNLIKKGDNIALVDDLLATGGSALAANELISKSGGVVKKFLFVIELLELRGRKKLPLKADIFSLVSD